MQLVFYNCIKYNGKTTNFGLLCNQCLEDLEKMIDEYGLRKLITQKEKVVEEKV